MSTSNVPESRQLMINLMYLVLTALLALNVTREVLNAFNTINHSLVRSNIAIRDKNNEIYQMLEALENTPSEHDKVKPYNDKAKVIRQKTQNLMAYLDMWKDSVISYSGGYEVSNGVKSIKNMADINASSELFIKQGHGEEIKKHLEQYIAFIKSQISDPSFKKSLAATMPLQVVDPPESEDNPKGDWVYGTFHRIPVVADVAMFSKFQNDIKNTEAMVLDFLRSQIHAEDYKFDALQAIAVPKTSYALSGQEIEATIMLAAYNKSVNPKITSTAGPVKVENGVGHLSFTASGAGLKTVKGVITIDKAGVTQTFDYEFDYMVGTAGASLQLDKMNVMYIGVDNPVTLSASGYNIEDVSLSMPGAKIKPKDSKGHYIVEVTKQGTMNYSINARTRSGGTTKVGGGEIRVKYIPSPVAEVGGISSGALATNVAKAQIGVSATLKNFDFETRFIVQSFHFVWIAQNGQVRDAQNSGGPGFSETTRSLMQQSRPGDKWIFEEIRALGPDKRMRKLNSVVITLN